MHALSALRQVAANKHARWSYGDANRDVEADLAVNRIYQGYFAPRFTPKFSFPKSARFFALGSCFAREIETALLRRGIDVTSRLQEIEHHEHFPVRSGVTTVHDFFNRYNVPSIAREIAHLSNASAGDLKDSLIYEQADGSFDDLHYTAAVQSAPLDAVIRRRHWLQEKLSAAYARSDVVILTLGLCEAWFDNQDSCYLNVVSTPAMLRRYAERLELRTISFLEAIGHLSHAVEALSKDDKRVILTVSPVPLQVTFTDSDVVIANTTAKCILRALCHQMAVANPNVDYFPSFEMVSYSEHSSAWRPDGRHVQMAMVEKIMSTALDAYIRT